jgi:hypothetical protein
VVPQPLLVSTSVNHLHQRHLTKRNYQTSVSTSLNQWLVKTVQRKTIQQILPTTQQTFLQKKHFFVQKNFLQQHRTEAFAVKRFSQTKKAYLLNTHVSSTSVRQSVQNKTVHLYQAPVSYHFVTNNARMERLVSRGINSNGLIFTGDSSLILTENATVTMT